jgi:hypothetical protein
MVPYDTDNDPRQHARERRAVWVALSDRYDLGASRTVAGDGASQTAAIVAG